MTTKKAPPPPSWGRRPINGEAAVLAHWEARVQYHAGRVPQSVARRLGMDRDDVCQAMRTDLLRAVRKFAWTIGNGAIKPGMFNRDTPGSHGALLTVVLRRRVSHLRRDAGVGFRMEDDLARAGMDEAPIIEDVAQSAEDAVTQADLDAVCQALVYSIQQNVPPAAFAILHLRIIEELTPDEIARFTGIPDNTKASKRIGYAKRVASDFLRSLGISTWEAVERAAEDGT